MSPARLRKEHVVQPSSSILVIDREPTIVDLLLEILTDEGYIAYTLPDGIDGLVAIARYPPGLILLDVGNLGMRDAELIEHMREAVLATTPMVLMTTAPRDTAALLVLGPFECLAKPFDLDDLLACVARYVQPAPIGEAINVLSPASGVASSLKVSTITDNERGVQTHADAHSISFNYAPDPGAADRTVPVRRHAPGAVVDDPPPVPRL
jgi:DNA-binding response OmpR family regulator